MANKLDEKTVAHNVRMNTDDQYRRNQYAKARYKEMGAAETAKKEANRAMGYKDIHDKLSRKDK